MKNHIINLREILLVKIVLEKLLMEYKRGCILLKEYQFSTNITKRNKSRFDGLESDLESLGVPQCKLFNMTIKFYLFIKGMKLI